MRLIAEPEETNEEAAPTTPVADQNAQDVRLRTSALSEASAVGLKGSRFIETTVVAAWPSHRGLLRPGQQRQPGDSSAAEPKRQAGVIPLGPPHLSGQASNLPSSFIPTRPAVGVGQPPPNARPQSPTRLSSGAHWQLGYHTVQQCAACRRAAVSPVVLVCSCRLEHAFCAAHLDLFDAVPPGRVKHKRSEETSESEEHQSVLKKSRRQLDLDSPLQSRSKALSHPSLAALSFSGLPQSTPRCIRSPSELSYVNSCADGKVEGGNSPSQGTGRATHLCRSFGVQTDKPLGDSSTYFDTASSQPVMAAGLPSPHFSHASPTHSARARSLSYSNLPDLSSFTSAQPVERTDSPEASSDKELPSPTTRRQRPHQQMEVAPSANLVRGLRAVDKDDEGHEGQSKQEDQDSDTSMTSE